MPGNFGNLLDSITFLAAAPDAIEPLAVRIGNLLGSTKYYYWVIAHFPIGNTITTSPGFIRDAPDNFTGQSYVMVSWPTIPGATSYDVIRTTTAYYPTSPGNYLVAGGATGSPVNDMGGTSYFDPSTVGGLPYGGPTECRITLNNKDYDRPTLLLPCSIRVTRIVFPDGSIQTSAPGSGGAPVNSVFGRQGDVIAVAGDYNASQVTNAVDQTQVYNNPTWIGSLAWSKITGVPPILTNPTTTKGDIIVNNGTTIVRLGVGTNGQVLTSNSAAPNGIDWETPAVTSFNGRTGAILPQTGDYNAAMVTNAVSTLGTYPDPPWITSLSWSKIIGAPTLVNSFNGRTGAVVPQAGDYTAAMVTNAISNLNVYSDPSWIGSLSWSKITGAPNFLVDPLTTKGDMLVRSGTGVDARLPVGTDGQVLTADSTTVLGVKWAAAPSAPVTSVFGRTGTVVALTGDYNASQVTNAVDQTQVYNNPSWIGSLAYSKITGAPAPVVPAAPNGALQFNNNGAFGGSANLIWDSSNNRLGIGSVPAYPLDVAGNTRTTGCFYIGPGATNLVTLCNDGSGHLLVNGAPITGGATNPAPPNTSVQWNSNGVFGGSGNFVYDSTNIRVGVGTTTPAYTVDIVSPIQDTLLNVRSTGSFSEVQIANDGSPGGECYIQFKSGSNFGAAINYDTDQDQMTLWSGSHDGAISVITCDTQGYAAIRNTAPRYALEVWGGFTTGQIGGAPVIPFTNIGAIATLFVGNGFVSGVPATNNTQIRFAGNAAGNSGNGGAELWTAGTDVYDQSNTNFYITQVTGVLTNNVPPVPIATPNLTLASGGNVGISNASPAYKLDIAGDCNITGIYRTNGASLTATLQTPWLQNIDAAQFTLGNIPVINMSGSSGRTASITCGGVGFQLSAGTSTTLYLYSPQGMTINTAGQMTFTSSVSGVPGYTFNTTSGNTVVITDTGKLGIGTSNNSLTQGLLTVRTAANQSLIVTTPIQVSGSITIRAINDAGTASVPLEIHGNPVCFFDGNVGFGGVTSPVYAIDCLGRVRAASFVGTDANSNAAMMQYAADAVPSALTVRTLSFFVNTSTKTLSVIAMFPDGSTHQAQIATLA